MLGAVEDLHAQFALCLVESSNVRTCVYGSWLYNVGHTQHLLQSSGVPYLSPVQGVGLAPCPPPLPSGEQAGCSGRVAAPQAEERPEGVDLSRGRRKQPFCRHNTDVRM